jgi:hypothetical protein
MAIGPIGERLQAAATLVAGKPISRSMHDALCLAHICAASWAGLVARAKTCFRPCLLVFSLDFAWFLQLHVWFYTFYGFCLRFQIFEKQLE